MIFRTAEQKADGERSWHRPDRPFFAAGACHILAAAFLEAYPGTDFQACLILPAEGCRGSHVFVSNAKTAFDYHGYSERDRYLAHYFKKIRRWFPAWQGEVIRLGMPPASAAFCEKYHHRLPSQFLHDPFPRAFTFIKRFRRP